MEKRYLTIAEASEYTGFAVATLYSWISQKKIRVSRRGGRVRFDKLRLDRFMQEGEQEAPKPRGKNKRKA